MRGTDPLTPHPLTLTTSKGSTQMQLKRIAANQTEVSLNNGTKVFFSYDTPVAAQLPDYEYVRTATKWSVTTSKHINKWLEGVIATEVSQDILDNLVA